jgi:hypothetical protein
MHQIHHMTVGVIATQYVPLLSDVNEYCVVLHYSTW